MNDILACLCVLVFPLLSANDEVQPGIYPAWVSIERDTNPTNIFINIIGKKMAPIIPLPYESPVRKALESFPLIDGHNDFPFSLYIKLRNNLTSFNFNTDLKNLPGWESSHTDIPRLIKGKVGGQFWSAFVFCETQYKDAVAKTMEQIDVIKRLIKKNSESLKFVTTADDIVDTFQEGKIASLIGIEGGHSIDSRLGVLRMYYELGVRYMTLTHTCNTPWATSSMIYENNTADYKNMGLTCFGKDVVLEMNRLGMMVDLAHVSHKVMQDALATSVAPVIFSHSSVYAVYQHPRNLHDDILMSLKKNRGIIMINFYPGYIAGDYADLLSVAAHINYVVDMIGLDHVGLGSDFDGIPTTPQGLEDVSKYPDLLEVVFRSNPERWTQRNLEKLIGRNLIRVFREVEKVRDELNFADPIQQLIPEQSLKSVKDNAWLCRTKFEKGAFEKLAEQLKKQH